MMVVSREEVPDHTVTTLSITNTGHGIIEIYGRSRIFGSPFHNRISAFNDVICGNEHASTMLSGLDSTHVGPLTSSKCGTSPMTTTSLPASSHSCHMSFKASLAI